MVPRKAVSGATSEASNCRSEAAAVAGGAVRVLAGAVRSMPGARAEPRGKTEGAPVGLEPLPGEGIWREEEAGDGERAALGTGWVRMTNPGEERKSGAQRKLRRKTTRRDDDASRCVRMGAVAVVGTVFPASPALRQLC